MEEEIKANKEEKKFEVGFSADGGRSPVCEMPLMSLDRSANLNSSMVEV